MPPYEKVRQPDPTLFTQCVNREIYPFVVFLIIYTFANGSSNLFFMQTHEKRSYPRLIKDIFKHIYNPDYVRLSFWEWVITSLIISVIVCLPISILIAVLWLSSPKEDSIFLFMLIPWPVIAPMIFIGMYVYNYRKPKRNDKAIDRLFELVEMDAPISPKSGCSYAFSKNNFLFESHLQRESAYWQNGNKKGHVDIMIMHMFYDSGHDNIQDYKTLVENMYAYSKNKQIAGHIFTEYYNILTIKLEFKSMTPELTRKIVDEFIYFTARFHLKPITLGQYAKLTEKIKTLNRHL